MTFRHGKSAVLSGQRHEGTQRDGGKPVDKSRYDSARGPKRTGDTSKVKDARKAVRFKAAKDTWARKETSISVSTMTDTISAKGPKHTGDTS